MHVVHVTDLDRMLEAVRITEEPSNIFLTAVWIPFTIDTFQKSRRA